MESCSSGIPRALHSSPSTPADRSPAAEKHKVQVKDLGAKVAGMLGTDPKQIAINDLAVNPLSGTVYLSVARGRGPDAIPVLVKIPADGKPKRSRLRMSILPRRISLTCPAQRSDPGQCDHRHRLRRWPRLCGRDVQRRVFVEADRHSVPVQQRGI